MMFNYCEDLFHFYWFFVRSLFLFTFINKYLNVNYIIPTTNSCYLNICLLQEPFNKVTYEMIGDDSGPSFFQLETNGDIKLRTGVNLPADKETSYTLRILAKDGGTPPNTATATVAINVDRNLNSPKFTNNTYKVDIPETLPAGSTVTAVTATDTDTSVCINVFITVIDL